MSEELENTNTEQVTQPDPVEVEAREQGWVPKEEFQGENHKWVDAGEYLRRGELFKKIESQSKELKEFKRALQEMGRLNAKIRDTEYQRALDTLRAEKKAALEDGDPDKLIEIDDKIAEVRQEQLAAKQEVAQNEPGEANPEFVDWVNKNSWYQNDVALRGAADSIGRELHAEGYTPKQVLKMVEERIKSEFPSKFRNPNKDKPGSVEGNASQRTTQAKESFTLTAEQRRFMKSFIASGAIKNEQEYIDQLKKVGG